MSKRPHFAAGVLLAVQFSSFGLHAMNPLKPAASKIHTVMRVGSH